MKIETIIEQFKSASDEGRKKRTINYIPTNMEVLGVRAPGIKKLVKTWWVELKELPPSQLVALDKDLVYTNIMECRHVGYELLWKNKKALSLLAYEDLNELKQGNDNWASVDGFCRG